MKSVRLTSYAASPTAPRLNICPVPVDGGNGHGHSHAARTLESLQLNILKYTSQSGVSEFTYYEENVATYMHRSKDTVNPATQ